MTVTPKQLETRRKRVARGLDEVHLDCRLIGHSWKRVPDTNEEPPMFGIRVCFDCTRCDSSRCDIVQRSNGQLLTRHYQYAEGYALESIDGERPTQADVLRYELVRRLDHDSTPPGIPAIGEEG